MAKISVLKHTCLGEDLDWNGFTNIINRHFRNKEKVNVIQFAPSDGSEAYTIIMNFLEKQPRVAEKYFPIQAYDIDKEIIDVAQSGIINMNAEDKISIQDNGIPFSKYFSKSNKQQFISGDVFSYAVHQNKKIPSYCTTSFKVTDILKNRVKFNYGDMFEVAKTLKDNSDTIVMCRNILGYFSEKEVEKFLNTLSSKLKSRSVLVVGNHDTKNKYFERLMSVKGFRQLMENVYRKI